LNPIVAIVAQGSMGAGLAGRLRDHGVRVLTSLAGRGAQSRARAEAAGMHAVEPEELLEAQFLLSILPPSNALPFAVRMAPLLRSARHKPVFADCNAVSPVTVQAIADALRGTGAPFVDVGIIGLPPTDNYPGPRLYAAGESARELGILNAYGLNVCLLDGPIGRASALKMSYAGITKGLAAVASAMILSADRSGVAAALREELEASAPTLLSSLARALPDMLPKAYRWVAEMQQIQEFVGDDTAARQIYAGAEHLYARIAADVAGGRAAADAIQDFF
jgi:L-threonate 2-dehydrogenase